MDSLAREFGIDQYSISSANPGKKIRAGEWLFIPLNIGFWHKITGEESYDDSYGSDFNVSSFFGDKLLWPVPASDKISSAFGKRWGKHHDGIDISASRGSHILAAATGKVVYSGRGLTGYGNMVVISHKNRMFTVYAHNKKNFVSKNQTVHRGQVIAQVGSTGKSTGPHLHFEVRRNSMAINPEKFLRENGMYARK